MKILFFYCLNFLKELFRCQLRCQLICKLISLLFKIFLKLIFFHFLKVLGLVFNSFRVFRSPGLGSQLKGFSIIFKRILLIFALRYLVNNFTCLGQNIISVSFYLYFFQKCIFTHLLNNFSLLVVQ